METENRLRWIFHEWSHCFSSPKYLIVLLKRMHHKNLLESHHSIPYEWQSSITTYHKIAWYSISPFSHWFTNSQSTANHQSSWPIFDPSETQPSLYQLHSLVCFSSPRRPTCDRFYHLEVYPNWISQTNHSNSSLVAISRSNPHLVRRETTEKKI